LPQTITECVAKFVLIGFCMNEELIVVEKQTLQEAIDRLRMFSSYGLRRKTPVLKLGDIRRHMKDSLMYFFLDNL